MTAPTLILGGSVRSGFANQAPAAMAKGAVEGSTLSLAAKRAPNVSVNCIALSLTRTRWPLP
jgi:NAD(P)-dependent dehydrogenase (short-subunit alcohol dehydrogenase family)